jgi:hypothetical protein
MEPTNRSDKLPLVKHLPGGKDVCYESETFPRIREKSNEVRFHKITGYFGKLADFFFSNSLRARRCTFAEPPVG